MFPFKAFFLFAALIRPSCTFTPSRKARVSNILWAEDPRRKVDSRSIAQRMYDDTIGAILKIGSNDEKPSVVIEKQPLNAERAISEIDKRARDGETTYQDFILMSRTFAELDGNVPGMPKRLSASEIAETKQKFLKHEKIVQAMTPEELANPQLMVEDLRDTVNKCPRLQRLSRESGVSERDVALFVAEFEVAFFLL